MRALPPTPSVFHSDDYAGEFCQVGKIFYYFRRGIFREMKLRSHYEKPSVRKVREKAEAIRRARKLARKKLQREGLLPMKPKVVSGAPGRRGPARAPRF